MKYFLLLVLSFVSANNSFANEGDLFITSGFFSRHFPDAGFRQVNPGLGFEYQAKENTSLVFGQYLNRLNNNTQYAGVFSNIKMGWVKAGLTAGLFDGYPTVNKGHFFIGAAPTFAIDNGRFGMNLVYLPRLICQVDVIAVQFKFKL
jgi:hypothetical protein